MSIRTACVLLLFFGAVCLAQNDAKPQYIRAGNSVDVSRKTQFGIALMGGGKDQDEAFRWMCQKANGGDFLILRATGTDAYNPYIQKLCPELNSVATLVIHSRQAANDPVTSEALKNAEAIFISGGDQSNYVKYWGGTAVTELINAAAQRGVPVGGTSAGLAVLGEYAYSAMNDTVQSADALANPFHERITIEHNFLKLPLLRNVIADSHFAKRDRMGRLAAFVSRIYDESLCWPHTCSDCCLGGQVRGIGIDERSVVLLEADGKAEVVGEGEGAYLLNPDLPREHHVEQYEIEPSKPLDFRVDVLHVPVSNRFEWKNMLEWKNWTASETVKEYTLAAHDGKLTSSKPDGKVY